MKSQISTQLVKHIAELANLDLDEEKTKLYQDQLEVIVEHFNDLKSLSFEDVPETSRIIEEENVWREDEVTPSFSQKEALKNSKKTYKDYFLVPHVLTHKDE